MPVSINPIRLQQIYDTYRSSALNRTYYGIKLTRYRQYNFGTEIAIAIGAPSSSGVAGLAVWGTLPGSYAWLVVSGIATVLAVVKPVLQFAGRIENYTKLYASYTGIFLELKDIVEEIAAKRDISGKTDERYRASRQLLRELAPFVDPSPSKPLIRKLQEQINREIPAESLWMPDA
jgi:hypothetical protein